MQARQAQVGWGSQGEGKVTSSWHNRHGKGRRNIIHTHTRCRKAKGAGVCGHGEVGRQGRCVGRGRGRSHCVAGTTVEEGEPKECGTNKEVGEGLKCGKGQGNKITKWGSEKEYRQNTNTKGRKGVQVWARAIKAKVKEKGEGQGARKRGRGMG